ncbi:MAG: VOC family protein [Chitinophagales bacterium]
MKLNFKSSVLFVEGIQRSRDFYENLLEQTVELDHGECVIYCGGFSIFKKDYAKVLGDSLTVSTNNNHNVELYFETEEIEGLQEKIFIAQVKLVHPINEQPWGQRVLRFFDPDGYIIEVGEPMTAVIKRLLAQGLSVEAVTDRTSMPIEAVRSCLD